MYVCMGFMALKTALVLCAMSQDSLLSASVRRLHVVFSTAGLKGGESRVIRHVKPPSLPRVIKQASRT